MTTLLNAKIEVNPLHKSSAQSTVMQIEGVAPSFSKKPTIRQEDDGNRLLFECKIVADPQPTVLWYHDGELLQAKSRYNMTLKKESGNNYDAILEIKDVVIEDAGKYKVVAKNELGESNASISLNFDNTTQSQGAKPIFTEKPSIKQGGDGKVIFECRLTADPKPTIEWLHKGKVVKEDSRHKYVFNSDKHNHTACLEISRVSGEDGGEYKCVARNTLGENSATINLNIDGGKPKIPEGKAPRFPKKPTIKQQDENDLILECILESNPFPEITWYHGSKVVNEDSRHKMSKRETGKDTYVLSLLLVDPAMEDSGQYRCNAINDFGESNANITLNFEGEDEDLSPEFVIKPKIIPKDGGSTIIMECRVKSTTKISTNWFKEKTQLKESNKLKTSVIPEGNDEYTIRIEIKNAMKDDGGQYRCNIKNDHGDINASWNLNLEAQLGGEPPTFVEKPKIIPDKDGKLITLEVKVRSKTNISTVWTMDGDVVKETSRIKQTIREEKPEIYIVRMEIKNPEITDAGLYRCNVKNEFGEANANLTLNITIVPVFKEKPKIVKHEKQKKIVIEVVVAAGDKPDVKWYRETNIVREDSRHSVVIREVSKGEYAVALEIEKPEKTDKGTYKVVAKNDKGESTSLPIKVEIEEPEEEKKPKGEKPKFISELKPMTVEEGKDAEFKCTIESKEKCTVTWYHKRTVIKETRNISTSFDGKTAILRITETKIESSGEYKVEISNSFGKSESSATLNVKHSIPQIQVEKEKSPEANQIDKKKSIPTLKEPTPEPEPGAGRRGSGRRGSFIDVQAVEQRRGSFIQAGKKGSIDARRPSTTEFDPTEKPSVPLKATPGDGCPPRIYDYQENQQGTEGKTAFIQFKVEGNPVPQFRFYKDGQEIYEGGRYVIVTDADNVVYFCTRKSKPADEGRYKIVATNKHGEASAEIGLFIGSEEGMDFRALLKRGKMQKWKRKEDDPDWGNLKAVEDERRASLKETKKPEVFTKPLQHIKCKEGRDKKVRFECVFSRIGIKAKWYKNKQELFQGKKYHMQSQADTHILEIINPTVDDEAKYVCKCLETTTDGFLEVEPPDPVYKFVKKLPPQSRGWVDRECVLECTCNSPKAPVKWYRGDKKLDESDKYIIEQDSFGKKFLRIRNCTLADSDEYFCKISNEEFTKTKLTIAEQAFKFMRVLRSLRVNENDTITLECELDDPDAPVTWYKDGQEVKPDKKVEIIAEGRKRKLVIKKCKLSDEGKYLCKTKGDETDCEVLVEPSNRFRKKLSDIKTLEKKTIVLEVELTESRTPLKWLKDGEEIKPSERIQFKFADSKQQCIIQNCTLEDAGEYTAFANKNLKCSCKVLVDEAEKPPKIDLDKTEFTGDSGKPLQIEIPYTVRGTRTSDVIAKLTRNGTPVNPREVEINVKNDIVTLTFKKPLRATSDTYKFTLSNDEGEDKRDLKIHILDVPTPPEGPLEIIDLFKDRCKLKWKPCKDTGGVPLLHYVIEQQCLSLRTGWQEIGTTDECKFDCKNLTPKKEYKFRVRAVNKKGSSEPLNASQSIIAKDPYDEPSKPGNLEVTDWDADHVDLKWEPPEKDGGAPITSYIVEFKDKFSPEWSKGPEVPGEKTKATVRNLKEGMQYQFRVKAVNKAGPGEPSDPTKPIIVKARFVKPYIIGDGLKNLIVKKGQVVKYDIQFGGEPPPEVKWFINNSEVSSGIKVSIEATAKTTNLVVKSAVRSDSGKYKLTLTNSSGTVSSEADVVVLDKPSAPEGPLVLEEVRADHVTIKWRRPKDDGGQDLKGYVIEKMDPDTGRWVPAGEVGPKEERFTVEGLTPKKKYKFRVKAVNKEGESEPLETDKPVLAKNPYDEPGKPGKPEIVDWDNTRVDLKWAAPESDGGKPITHYIIEMKDKLAKDFTEVMKTEGPATEVTVPNLKQGNTVQFRVRAVNIAGPSEPSEATEPHLVKHRNLKPQIDRTNLKNVTIKVGKGVKFAVDIIGEPPPAVTWTFGDDQLKLSDDENFTIKNEDYHSDFNLTKAKRKHSGKYTITAKNASGTDSVTVDIIVIGKPAKPEGPLQVSNVHKEGCTLSWKKPKDDGGLPIKYYDVEKLDTETGRWTRCGKTDKPELEVTGLTPGKEYMFRCTAVNDEGDSEPLETTVPIIAKNPYDEPGKPGTPEIVDWDNKSVDLKWEKPKSDGGAPITSYIVEKKEKFAFSWQKAAEVPGDKCEAKVEDLIEQQEYQFRVVAVNKAGPGEPSDPTKSHLVKHRKLKPYIDRTNLETTTIKKGKSLKLDVNVRGEPPPKITWKLKDKVITNDEFYEIVNVDYNTKFGLNNGQRQHSGKYTIIAENEHGKDEADVEIVVLGAPSMPKGPLKVENVHKKGCKLKWEKPEDDGGKPITGYVVEKLDVKTGTWVPVGRTDGTEMEVSGLIPGKKYKFRVKAVNPEGESEPLVTDMPITAKDPYEEAKAPTDVEIEDYSEKHVDLKWKPPLDDGGAPITGYIIEKKEKFGNWEPCLETNTTAPKAKVEGLIKGKEYQFRVKAVNKAGP
ncbi:twitchin-like isoform X8, partial [Dinothrombium tinctorium]